MKEIEVEFWKDKKYLTEIYQLVGMQFAFLSADNKQCHQWVKCKDFLHDVLRNCTIDKKDAIYGFCYDPKVNPPMDLEKMRLLVKIEVKDSLEIMESAINILNCIEKYSSIEPLSELCVVKKAEHVYMIGGAKDWIESTFMISLYTFLIRLGAKKLKFENKEEFDSKLADLTSKKEISRGDNDLSYLKTVFPFIYNILKERENLKYTRKDGTHLFDKETMSIFHNYSGIVSLVRQLENKCNNKALEELAELSNYINIREDKKIKMKKAGK